MEAKRLMKVTYQDLKKGIRLNAYADAVIWSEDPSPTLAGLRFGGYAEVVRGLTDAIYGGATIEIEDADGSLLTLKSLSKQYHREVSHEGLYAEATLIAEDEIQESSKSQDEKSSKHAQKDDLFDDNVPQQDIPAHICYIFCHPGNEDELFQAIDQKSYVPMIPEYQDYVLAELKRRRILRPLRVRSLYQELEAWKLCCEAKDQNLVKVMEDGLKQGKIKIPGAAPGPSLLDGVHSVTDYLNTFGVAVDALEAGRTAFDCGSEWSNAPLWYTSGEAISNVLDELSISSVLTESRVTSAASAAADSASSGADAVLSIPALLPQEADGKLPDATAPDAVNVRVCFDDDNATGFSYDADSGLYRMLHADGTPQLDANNGQQAGFDNLLVLFSASELRDDGKTYDYDLSMGGGVWLNGGHLWTITWTQGRDNTLLLYDADGRTMNIEAGTSYIALVTSLTGQELTVTNSSGEAILG